MYLILTDTQSMIEEAQRENFAKILKEAEEYQKRKEEWQRLHPPCPHCGHQEQLPIYLQY